MQLDAIRHLGMHIGLVYAAYSKWLAEKKYSDGEVLLSCTKELMDALNAQPHDPVAVRESICRFLPRMMGREDNVWGLEEIRELPKGFRQATELLIKQAMQIHECAE